MSILGKSYSKYIASDGTEVTLEHSKMDTDPKKWQKADVLEHRSILTGKVNYIPLGNYAEFDIVVHLGKYQSDANAKFIRIKQDEHTDVTFYPFSDGNPLYDMSGQPAKFYVESVEPYYLTQTEFYDVAKIRLTSNGYVTLKPRTNLGYGYGYGYNYGH